ncbi:MAG: CPBP family intramembrane metalloprotease [Bacteroidia bacterium]|nr:CPBP family intramembrane metalloprotease [Bacteroidia bacterium]
MKTLLGIAILSLDSGFPYMRDLVSAMVPDRASYWAYKVGINAMSFVTVLLPAGVFYVVADRTKSRFYGLAQFRFDWKPYVTMLLIMLPLITAASFLPSFRNFYPMYPVTPAHEALGTPVWVPTLIYELAYGADFITVEFLFRGFFVIGMIPLLGRNAVLPMVAVYCLLHFGKPAGEAISSIAGGFILGVVAYETRSIWGGVAVHVGIAWLMELAAWLQQRRARSYFIKSAAAMLL